MPKWRINLSLRANSQNKANESAQTFINDVQGKLLSHNESKNPIAVKRTDASTSQEYDAVIGSVFIDSETNAKNLYNKWKGMMKNPNLVGKISIHLCSHGEENEEPCNTNSQLEVFEI